MRYPAPDGLVAASTNTEGLPSWDLTDLYPAPGSPALEADLSRAAADAQAFQAQYAGTLAARSGAELAAALAANKAVADWLDAGGVGAVATGGAASGEVTAAVLASGAVPAGGGPSGGEPGHVLARAAGPGGGLSSEGGTTAEELVERTRSQGGTVVATGGCFDVLHAGHLALSVASGALYGALKPAGAPPVEAGLAFGAGFLALAYGGAGPALRLTPPPWRDTPANNVQHAVVHALFGIATALVADRIERKLAHGPRRR